MRSKTKRQLIILGIVFAALIIFILILDANKPPEEEVIEIPEGGLSESLFDSQNPDYVKSESFPRTVELTHMPYTYDTIDEDGAVVGTGTIYQAGDYYLYVAEVPKNVRTSTEVTDQFSKALKIDASTDTAGFVNLKQNTGFINGHGAEYEVDYVSVQDGRTLSGAYILCYRLEIEEEPKECDLIVGCATVNGTNADLQNCQAIANALVYTVQYDEELDRTMTRERENQQKEAEKEALEQQSSSSISTLSSGTTAGSGTVTQGGASAASTDNTTAGGTSNGPTEEVASSASFGGETLPENPDMVDPSGGSKTLGVLLKQSYNDLTVRIHWTNPEIKPTMKMSDVKGEHTYEPSEYGEGSADFHIGAASDGVYMVTITDYVGAGTFTSELIGQ